MNTNTLRDSSVAFLQRAKPFILVTMLQFTSAGSAILAKSALNNGMSHLTYSVYSSLLGSIVLAPLAFFLERKNQTNRQNQTTRNNQTNRKNQTTENNRPQLSRLVVLQIVLLALLEPVARRNLYYAGMRYTTATYAQSMNNLLPAISFVFAWLLQVEQVNWRQLPSQAKILGTCMIVGGAFLMTLVTRPTISLPWTRERHGGARVSNNSSSAEHSSKGPLLIFAGCVCSATYYTLQAYTVRAYPDLLSLTCMICAVGALQATLLTFIVERDNLSVWSLGTNSILIACVYSGVLTSGLSYYISGYLTKKRSHVFVTSFNPLSMIVVAILSSVVLNEKFNYGRVFGALGIIIGLYLYLWGEKKNKKTSDDNGDQQSDQGDPDINDEEAMDPISDQREPVIEQSIEANLAGVSEQSIEANYANVSDSGDEIVEVIE